jgi:NADH:ubiquinone oxidoreductase subunit 4 (subunit M)
MLEEDTVECSIAFCIVLVFLRKLAIDLFRKIFFFFFFFLLLLLSGCVCVCMWGGEMRYQERIKIIAVFVAKAFSIMSGGCRQVVRW